MGDDLKVSRLLQGRRKVVLFIVVKVINVLFSTIIEGDWKSVWIKLITLWHNQKILKKMVTNSISILNVTFISITLSQAVYFGVVKGRMCGAIWRFLASPLPTILKYLNTTSIALFLSFWNMPFICPFFAIKFSHSLLISVIYCILEVLSPCLRLNYSKNISLKLCVCILRERNYILIQGLKILLQYLKKNNSVYFRIISLKFNKSYNYMIFNV